MVWFTQVVEVEVVVVDLEVEVQMSKRTGWSRCGLVRLRLGLFCQLSHGDFSYEDVEIPLDTTVDACK